MFYLGFQTDYRICIICKLIWSHQKNGIWMLFGVFVVNFYKVWKVVISTTAGFIENNQTHVG